jgi:anti-sigma factor (TIGR02949 family)
MSCDLAGKVLHGYLDNELDAVRAAEFERHLEQCSECMTALEQEESVRTAINRAHVYAVAPAALRSKIVAAVTPAPKTIAIAQRSTWRWLPAAAAIILVVFTGWRLLPALRGDSDEAVLAAQTVDAHLRSMQPGHLTDVLSTDQHTVKPWFDGRVDFAPPVQDFSEQGFPLQGGRLDIIQSHTVAALVYGRRKHFVNVFIWPTHGADNGPRTGTHQGYQWTAWRKRGMQFYAVSDVSGADLQQLQRLLNQ